MEKVVLQRRLPSGTLVSVFDNAGALDVASNFTVRRSHGKIWYSMPSGVLNAILERKYLTCRDR